MKLIYVCSPYSGEIEENTKKAREYSRYVADQKLVPVAPHLLFPQFVSEESERELAIDMNTVLLGRCDELWVFGNRISKGMRKEIALARDLQIPIRYFKQEQEQGELQVKEVL